VLDPLYARALYLRTEDEQLLWMHCDLIGFADEFVREFVTWAEKELTLAPHQILLTATHTHSGPCTLRLEEAGRFDPEYLAGLGVRLRSVAQQAMANLEPCRVVAVSEELVLAIDRRSRRVRSGLNVSVLGFVREDGGFGAVIANYPIHPVALGAQNNQISADISGTVANALSAKLPGRPLALATNGACGELNPPEVPVRYAQVEAWGGLIAGGVARRLQAAAAEAVMNFGVARADIALPLEVLSPEQIERFATDALGDQAAMSAWGAKFRRVVEKWRGERLDELARGTVVRARNIALTVMRLNVMYIVTVNAEIFSDFTDQVRALTGKEVVVVGYANGNWGYIAPRSAYTEGGYEVERAHLFYGAFRFQAGGLERLAGEAAGLVKKLSGAREIRAVSGHAP
jgi:hypothetical protein